jgi:hypothetical protein
MYTFIFAWFLYSLFSWIGNLPENFDWALVQLKSRAVCEYRNVKIQDLPKFDLARI